MNTQLTWIYMFACAGTYQNISGKETKTRETFKMKLCSEHRRGKNTTTRSHQNPLQCLFHPLAVLTGCVFFCNCYLYTARGEHHLRVLVWDLCGMLLQAPI